MGPIEFKKTKEERFNKVISVMKDIGKSQEAYKSVNGKYAKDFNGLIKFIDTANYTITQQRDSSFMEFNKVYGIDMLKEIKIIDTLGTVSVKDSLFKKDNRYKTMMNVPFAKNGEKFTLAASAVERTGGYLVPVFEAKVKKDVILHDQPNEYRIKENAAESIEQIDGDEIVIGSLTEVSTLGNWPQIYDKKEKK